MTNAIVKTLAAGALLLVISGAIAARAGTDPSFTKITLSDKFYSEGCTFGDFNKDGVQDYAAGPFWYEGPDFQKRHTIYEPKEFNGAHEYSQNFLAFAYDFNNDGWIDYFVVGFPGAESRWYENPQGKDEPWKVHPAFAVTDNESPRFADITGDGKPELICMNQGFIGYAEPNWEKPDEMWTFHKASKEADKRFHKFTHGLGYGDLNGDGKVDLLEAQGWWEQPASLSGDPEWKFHKYDFGKGGAQMYTYDVNGDGKADVITSYEAHHYGLYWYEQMDKDADGNIKFGRHDILSAGPKDSIDGVQFSQLHAVALFDMDGDGLKDIITGKRRWAHGDHGDPEPNAPPVLYWFQLTRENGKVKYVPHKIDDDSGVGTQVTVGDINGDGLGDVMVGNKRGQFVFIQKPK